MDNIEQIKYDYWWAGMDRAYPGSVKKTALSAGGTKHLYEMGRDELINIEGISEKYADDIIKKRQDWNLDAEYEKLLSMGIDFIPYYDGRYPERLKLTQGHPFGLFCKGSLPPDDVYCVAVIGTRNCSEYGRMMARRFASDLAGYGVAIVSGMAYGIDGISQEAALNAGGRSYAILGCGVNTCYPASNRVLYERLKENGGVLSEYGIYTKPSARLFPARNRIISGLADILLVVEAREKSGTMITVDMALEQGREVTVIPGRITDPLSTGCNRLIKQGATPVMSAEDIMYMLDESFDNNRKTVKLPKVKLDENEKKVYELLEPYARSIGDLSEASGLELKDVICSLVELGIKGLAAETGKGYYVRTRECMAV
jgi:DNA processing protein